MATVRHSGLYRKSVELLINQPVQKGAGKEDNYIALYIGRGYLKLRSGGGRQLQTGEVVQNNYYDLWIRYATLSELKRIEAKLKTDTKVKVGSKVYTIGTWDNVEEKNFELHFVLNVQ